MTPAKGKGAQFERTISIATQFLDRHNRDHLRSPAQGPSFPPLWSTARSSVEVSRPIDATTCSGCSIGVAVAEVSSDPSPGTDSLKCRLSGLGDSIDRSRTAVINAAIVNKSEINGKNFVVTATRLIVRSSESRARRLRLAVHIPGVAWRCFATQEGPVNSWPLHRIFCDFVELTSINVVLIRARSRAGMNGSGGCVGILGPQSTTGGDCDSRCLRTTLRLRLFESPFVTGDSALHVPLSFDSHWFESGREEVEADQASEIG